MGIAWIASWVNPKLLHQRHQIETLTKNMEEQSQQVTELEHKINTQNAQMSDEQGKHNNCQASLNQYMAAQTAQGLDVCMALHAAIQKPPFETYSNVFNVCKSGKWFMHPFPTSEECKESWFHQIRMLEHEPKQRVYMRNCNGNIVC